MNTLVSQALRATTHASRQRGFSLIELMIVVAIISILAMIALPQYQKYAAKAKIAAALSELSAGKAGVETLIAEGFIGGGVPPEQLGLPLSSENCQRFESSGTSSSMSLTCYVKRDRYLGMSVAITLDRSIYGRNWTCRAYIMDESLLPEMCRRS